MNEMKYKKGDRVLVKSLQELKADGYSCGQGPNGLFITLPGGYDFIQSMEPLCGQVLTVTEILPGIGYTLGEGDIQRFIFTDVMIKGRVCNQ